MKEKIRATIIMSMVGILLFCVPVFAKKPYIKVTSKTKVTIPKGYRSKIKAVPKGKKCKLTYKTSKKSVATVTSKGVIKGKKYGSATITIKGKGLKSKKIKVYIKNPIKSLKVTSSTWITLSNVGNTSQIKASVSPTTKIVTKKLTYKSSNPKVATVSSNGLITGKSVGYADITVSTSSLAGPVRKTTIFVFVNQNLKSIQVPDISVNTWQSKQVTFVKNPTDSTLKDITYTSADPNIATVDEQGVVTGIASTNQSTTVTVRATDTSGVQRIATAKINVVAGGNYQWPSSGVTIQPDDANNTSYDDPKLLRLQLDPVALNQKIAVLFRTDSRIYSYSFTNITEDFTQLKELKVGTSKTNKDGIKVTKTYGTSTGNTHEFTITLPNGQGTYTLTVNTETYQLKVTGEDTTTNRIMFNQVL